MADNGSAVAANGTHRTSPSANGTQPTEAPVLTFNSRMVNVLERLVTNYSTLRQRMLERNNQKRDIDFECDYPTDPTPFDYKRAYDREPIARRTVNLYPKECWQVQPTVYQKDTTGEEETAFEKAWDGLSKGLRGEKSWHAQEEGSIVWSYLRRLDEFSGIGHYGVLLLGFDDIPASGARTLGDPVKKGKRKLLFMKVFPETLAQVATWDNEPGSPRYGKPVSYNITFNDPTEGQQGGIGLITGLRMVHWTRVIHVADNAQSGDVLGTPRLQVVINRIRDLEKEYGGAGEGFWQNAFPVKVLETHPSLGGDVDVNLVALKDMLEQVRNGTQREIILEGMTGKTIPPSALDPTPWLSACIEAICIVLGCPVRIFKGSERGELASSQDDDSWNDRLKERQNTYLTPMVVVPFVDRLIQYGVLPEPEGEGYVIDWPDLTSRSDTQKAAVGLQRVQALASYETSGAKASLSLHDFYVMCWGVTDEEAEALVEAAQEQAAQMGIDPAGGAALAPDPNDGMFTDEAAQGDGLNDAADDAAFGDGAQNGGAGDMPTKPYEEE